eukprot:13049527-Alexandrium_andersonii.AAC.1
MSESENTTRCPHCSTVGAHARALTCRAEDKKPACRHYLQTRASASTHIFCDVLRVLAAPGQAVSQMGFKDKAATLRSAPLHAA